MCPFARWRVPGGGRPGAPCALPWVSVATAAIVGLAARALAQEQADTQGGSMRVEEHMGSGDPFGDYGMALVYDRGGRFSGGFGLGLYALKRVWRALAWRPRPSLVAARRAQA